MEKKDHNLTEYIEKKMLDKTEARTGRQTDKIQN